MLKALAGFAVLNAVLYSLLLPLWEGFDEPFHYGYVQTVARRHAMPRLGRTPVSEEILQSLRLAPASPAVRQNLPFALTFSEFQALPAPERVVRRRALTQLPPALASRDVPDVANYEAQQAPLAYLLMAPADWLWRDTPLPARVVRLRVVYAVAGCLLQLAATLALARVLELQGAARLLAVFLTLSAQMFYASVAHVANDWLAIPLSTWGVAEALRYWHDPRYGNAGRLGCALALGLLTKAYFLAWLLFAVPIVLWAALRRGARREAALFLALVLAIAGPWYARNLALYGSLSGAQSMAGSVSSGRIARAALDLPWHTVVPQLARGSVWTGNNSFSSFSSATVDVVLALLAAGAVLWARTAGKLDRLAAAGCLLFLGAELYAIATVFAFTGGKAVGTAPWYTQAIAAPLACLVSLGVARSPVVGRWVGAALAAVFAYVLAGAYFLKLIPLYAGSPAGGMTLSNLFDCYFRNWHVRQQMLAQTALASPDLILVLAAAVALSAAVFAVSIGRSLIRS